jgi:hypothetical protein
MLCRRTLRFPLVFRGLSFPSSVSNLPACVPAPSPSCFLAITMTRWTPSTKIGLITVVMSQCVNGRRVGVTDSAYHLCNSSASLSICVFHHFVVWSLHCIKVVCVFILSAFVVFLYLLAVVFLPTTMLKWNPSIKVGLIAVEVSRCVNGGRVGRRTLRTAL